MTRLRVICTLCMLFTAVLAYPSEDSNLITPGNTLTKKSMSSDDLLNEVYSDCLHSDVMPCVRVKVLTYLQNFFGSGKSYRLSERISIVRNDQENETSPLSEEELESSLPRSWDAKDKQLDVITFNTLRRLMRSYDVKFQLPQLFFDGAVISMTPKFLDDEGPEFNVDFPNENSRTYKSSRTIKKLLIPLLLALKLKFKALLPLAIGLVGIKAFKALILSKLAILLVGILGLMKLCKKGGGGGGGLASLASGFSSGGGDSGGHDYQPYHAPPAPSYGAPAGNSGGWEASTGGGGSGYSRNWDPQQMAYRAYYQQQQQVQQTQQHQQQQVQQTQQQPQYSAATHFQPQ